MGYGDGPDLERHLVNILLSSRFQYIEPCISSGQIFYIRLLAPSVYSFVFKILEQLKLDFIAQGKKTFKGNRPLLSVRNIKLSNTFICKTFLKII